MITLYHGSNIEIDEIDLSRCKAGKDFGRGFYLNPNYDQALKMAAKTFRILGEGAEIVNSFEFDDTILTSSSELKIKIFADYSEEWADFIVMNRKNHSGRPMHSYDIVIGPIADDTVGVQIRRYLQGYMPASKLVEELRFHGDHAIQYFFHTERSLSFLKKK